MKKAKTIKIFPAPHVEVRTYPSVKIMRKKVKENEVINTEEILTLIKKIIEVQHKGNAVAFSFSNYGMSVFAARKEEIQNKKRPWGKTFHLSLCFDKDRKKYDRCMEYLEELIKKEEEINV